MDAVKGFFKIQFIHSSLSHSGHCSMMFLRVKMWSVQPLPFRNLACSFLSTLSTAADNRFTIILQKIFLGTDSRVMPRQLLQLVRSHFLEMFTIVPLHQSSGMIFSFHIVTNKGTK